MTTQEIIDYYADLLILQYVGQPKAYATVQAVVRGVIMDQMPVAVQNAFEIGTAVGVQLDILGKYVGVTRYGNGFNGDPITLDDADFTALIRMAIVRNNSGSSLSNIQDLLAEFFYREIFVYDHANMQMGYLMTSTAGSLDLAQMFVTQGLLPKPMGVQLSSLIYLPAIGLFGLRDYRVLIAEWDAGTTYAKGAEVSDNGVVYSSLVAGNLNHDVSDTAFWEPIIFPLNDYTSYQTDWPWLDYRDTIVIV